MKCTWIGCDNHGLVHHYDADGKEWAYLCESHNELFDETLEDGDTKQVMQAWVRAQGVAKIASKRALDGIY